MYLIRICTVTVMLVATIGINGMETNTEKAITVPAAPIKETSVSNSTDESRTPLAQAVKNFIEKQIHLPYCD